MGIRICNQTCQQCMLLHTQTPSVSYHINQSIPQQPFIHLLPIHIFFSFFKLQFLIFYSIEMNKVYITNLDSPLGYHLVDLIRNDHVNPDTHTLIIGSAEGTELPLAIHQAIKISEFPNVALRAILDCDLLILNLDHSSHQAQLILKFLQNSHSSLSKVLRVIGISTLMTWQGLKPYELEKQSTDRQRMLSAILDEGNWKRNVWSEKEYQRRVPNNLYLKTYQLENMMIRLNRHPKICATVAACGLIYGRESTAIQNQIVKALAGQRLSYYGTGDNYIPLTHIETLLESIEKLISQKQVPYAIICDTVQYTQKQIKQMIIEACGNTEPLTHKQSLYILKEQCDWSTNLTTQPSTICIPFSQSRTFQSYTKHQLLSDFCDYCTYTPKQYLVLIEKYPQNALSQLTSQLKGRCQMILQQQINKIDQQIIIKMTPPEPQLPPNKKQPKNSIIKPSSAMQERQPIHYFKQAFEKVLKCKKYQNFVLVVKESMLKFLDHGLIFSKMTQIVPQKQYDSEDEDAQPQQSKKQTYPCDDTLIFESDQYCSSFNLPPPSNLITPCSLNTPQFPTRQQANAPYHFQSTARKDDQLVLLNQYLLDNVIMQVSQAKFSLRTQRKEVNLRNFIQELKEMSNKIGNVSMVSSQQ